MLDFWMPVFWILVDICTPGTAFPCTVGARVAKPGCCSGGNRKVVHCSVPVRIKMVIVKA